MDLLQTRDHNLPMAFSSASSTARASILNTCTVSVLEEAHRKSPPAAKTNDAIRTQRLTPRRNSCTRWPFFTQNTRITVPRSEAVASSEPLGEKLSAERGVSCALIVIPVRSLFALKIRSSPLD